MPECQFQRIVTQYFQDHSRLVAKWPLPFLVIPLLVTAALAFGFMTHLENLNNSGSKSGDKLSLFLPDDVPAVRDLKELSELFPPKDAIRDNYDMFGATFAYVVVEDITPHANVIRNYPLLVANDLHSRIQNIKVQLDSWYTASIKQLCFTDRITQSCVQHPILFLLNTTDPVASVRYFLGYPNQVIGEQTVDNTMLFGSVGTRRTADGREQIVSAQAMRLAYVLRQPASVNERAMVVAWQNAFLDLVSSLRYPGINLYYTSAVSWSQEIERNGSLILPYMPLLFVVLVVFSVCSCFTADWVVSKPWLALCGIANALCAVIATMGTLVVIGYPFLTMVFIMPFLIMSISVDNMFLMLNSWRATHPLKSVEERMGRAIGDTAVSIMITALTDGLSFSVGSVSKFPAVRIFCTYCALAILFVFVYQMTFFTACMALLGRREAANRHCVTFRQVLPKAESGHTSLAYRIFCAGGYNGRAVTRTIPTKFDDQMITEFFSTTYANLLKVWAVKAVVILSYILYLGGSCYGLMQLPVGLELKVLVPRNSYLTEELEAQTRHFTAYGGFSFCVTKGAEIKYFDPSVNRHVVSLYRNLTRTEFTDSGDFWLMHFNLAHRHRVFNSEAEFLRAVRSFLSQPQNQKFANDIHFDEQSGAIDASKMLIRMRNVGFSNHTQIVRTLRGIFAHFGLPGFIYESSFLLVDQQQSTIENVALNVVVAVVVMIFIAILFMPRLVTAVWIGVSIFSINLGVVGGLAMWDVRLDIVSMITIVMSIGFSVDFAAHITYHFMISSGGEHRLNKAMKFVGTPVLQAAASTALGVMSLAPVDSYMVRTFVKTVVLVVGLGLLHGLLFLPVFLSVLVPASQYLESLEIYREIGHYLANNVPRYLLHQIRNKRMQCYQAEPVDSRAMSEQIRAETIGGATALSARNKLGGLHASKRYPKISADPPLPAPTRRSGRSTSADLYEFLKYKREQLDSAERERAGRQRRRRCLDSLSRSVSSEDLYSEPLSLANRSSSSGAGLGTSSAQTENSERPLLLGQGHRQQFVRHSGGFTMTRSEDTSTSGEDDVRSSTRHDDTPDRGGGRSVARGMSRYRAKAVPMPSYVMQHRHHSQTQAIDQPRIRRHEPTYQSHRQFTNARTDIDESSAVRNHRRAMSNRFERRRRQQAAQHQRIQSEQYYGEDNDSFVEEAVFPPPPRRAAGGHVNSTANINSADVHRAQPFYPAEAETVRIALGGQAILKPRGGSELNLAGGGQSSDEGEVIDQNNVEEEVMSDVFTVIQPGQITNGGAGLIAARRAIAKDTASGEDDTTDPPSGPEFRPSQQPAMRTFARSTPKRGSTIIEAYSNDVIEVDTHPKAIHL